MGIEYIGSKVQGHVLNTWVSGYLDTKGPPWFGCWAGTKAVSHSYLDFEGHPLWHVRGDFGGSGSGSHEPQENTQILSGLTGTEVSNEEVTWSEMTSVTCCRG